MENYQQILKDYSIYVFQRPGFEINNFIKIYVVKDVPYMQISASFIRSCIKSGKDVSYLPEKAWKYLDEMNFIKNEF